MTSSKWPGKDPNKDYSIKRHFNGEMASEIALMLTRAGLTIDETLYKNTIEKPVLKLELKERSALMAKTLEAQCKEDFTTIVEALPQALPPALPTEKGSYSAHYKLNVIATYVEKYGSENPTASLAFIEELTQRHTCEFAIRPLITYAYDETYAQINKWTTHESFHLRRLASEGLRPRLPWASKIGRFIEDPSPIIPIISSLKNDSSPYVRRSVANNLNDISRDHPRVALTLAEKWMDDKPSAEVEGVVAHGLRTLLKAEDAHALKIANVDAKRPL